MRCFHLIMFVNQFFRVTAICVAVCAALALSACTSSMHMHAQSGPTVTPDNIVNAQIGDLTIRGAWARPTVAADSSMSSDSATTGMNSAAYMVIENKGPAPDRLLDVTGDVAKMVQLHQTTMANGVMKMEHLPDGAEIPAGGSLVLKPASFHVMFIDVQQKLAPGGSFKLTLKFEKAGSVTIDVPVRQP